MEPKSDQPIPVTPHLERKAEFEAVLSDYHINAEGMRILAATPFVCLIAPTSTGRNTIINELLKTGNYYFLVSDNTRPPRYNDGVLEQNGVEYFFRTEEEMLQELREGTFIEAELIHNQQVCGTSVREVAKANTQGKVAITDMDIEGGCNMASLKPDSTRILLLPPSFDEWLRRIHKRTPLKPEELHRRLQGATKVLSIALSSGVFTFVINDDFASAVKEVDELARLGIHHDREEATAHALAQTIYDQTCAYLAEHAPGVTPWHS